MREHTEGMDRPAITPIEVFQQLAAGKPVWTVNLGFQDSQLAKCPECGQDGYTFPGCDWVFDQGIEISRRHQCGRTIPEIIAARPDTQADCLVIKGHHGNTVHLYVNGLWEVHLK